jgi:ABC-type sugar transport system ATPase subunit
MCPAPVASLSGVSKRFGATCALDDVSLELLGGEVHVLAGENGAGKSTLIRILAGVIGDYVGEVHVSGEPAFFASPAEARRAGVATIHQELSLIGSMTVADNIALVEAAPAWRTVSPARQATGAREVLALLSLDVDPTALVETLPLATRQLIEIARALAQDARVLIMDEPTSALSEGETERLFAELATLRERGVAIIFITHRLDEIYRVADRITVLRDGAHVITAPPDDLPRGDLVRHMVGADRAPRKQPASRAAGTDTAVEVRHQEVRFRVAVGEVVAITGLHGSGADVLPRAIFGAEPADVEITLAGERLVDVHPRACIARGMILLSGDRDRSLVQTLSVVSNTTLSALAAFSRGGYVDSAAEERAAAVARERLHIDCPSLHAEVWQLSGGNQQKVAIARCLEIEPRVLLLHEPSRGIDVGAKAEVHALIAELAASGVAIVVVGTDLEELMAVADRMLVMSRGAVVLELDRAAYSRARILEAAMGGASS